MRDQENNFITESEQGMDGVPESTYTADKNMEAGESAGLEYGQPIEEAPPFESSPKQVIDEAAKESVEQTIESDQNEEDAAKTLGEEGFGGVVNVEQTAELLAIRSRHEKGEALTEEDVDRIADLAVNYLRQILSCFGETKSTIDEYEGDDGELILEVNGGDLAILIGRHGHTLSALQQVVSSYVAKRVGFRYPLVVDIEGYRDRSKNIVANIAQKAAHRAKECGRSVSLKPMNAYERRLVHLALKDDEELETYSKGEEPHRFVVINIKSPAKGFEEEPRAEGGAATGDSDEENGEWPEGKNFSLDHQDEGFKTVTFEEIKENSAE